MLEVRDLQVYYGMIHAIKGISFDVNQGEVIALIGANGAGKTTTLHTITGLLAPKSGSVLFEGKDITKVPAHKIVSMGMAHVPEGRRVFAELSVYENLKMGAYTRKDKKEIEESLANVYKRFPRLEERADDLKQNQHRKRQRGQNQNRGFRPPAVDLPAGSPVGGHNVRQGGVEVQVRGKIQHADHG